MSNQCSISSCFEEVKSLGMCYRHYKRQWRRKRMSSNKPLKGSHEYTNEYRLKAIELLGGMCNRCGFNDVRALQFDHINNDGAEERRCVSLGVYYHSIMAGRDDIQVLCANCNWIKRTLAVRGT